MSAKSTRSTKRPPSKAALRRERRAAEDEAFDKRALEYWFKLSGTTRADLDALMERYPAVTKDGVRLPGLSPEVLGPVFDLITPLEGIDRRFAVVAIARAMENLTPHSPLSGEALLRAVGL